MVTTDNLKQVTERVCEFYHDILSAMQRDEFKNFIAAKIGMTHGAVSSKIYRRSFRLNEMQIAANYLLKRYNFDAELAPMFDEQQETK